GEGENQERRPDRDQAARLQPHSPRRLAESAYSARMGSRLAVAVTLAVALVLPGAALAAPIDVTNTGDEKTSGNGCSLREAVLAANADDHGPGNDCTAGSGADTIRLEAATYKLTAPGSDSAGLVGDLDMTEGLTIVGAGRT